MTNTTVCFLSDSTDLFGFFVELKSETADPNIEAVVGAAVGASVFLLVIAAIILHLLR